MINLHLSLYGSFFLFLSAFFYTNTAAANSTADSAFLKLANEYFDTYYFPTYPTLATQLGIHTYDNQIEDYSKAGIDHDINALKKFEERVSKVNPSQLSLQIQGDRDLVLNDIRSQLLTLQRIQPWQKNPDYYSSGITSSAFVIMERKFAPPEDRLRALIAREKLMPGVLQEAHHLLKNPPKIYTQIALEQLPGLISFFQKDVPAAFNNVTDPSLQKQFNDSNAAVIGALTEYQQWLKTDVLPQSHGDYRIGKEVFLKKLKYDEMVDMPLDKLIAIDTKNMRENQNEFKRIANELYPGKPLSDVLNEINSQHPQADKLLDVFRGTFDNLISFIKDKKIITIPSDVRPIMEETPPFLRSITFASMDTPGPFEKNANEAYFNVTLPNPAWDKKMTEEFMSQFSYPSISSVAIHEAYPGHYVQFLWMHDVHDRVRKILGARSNAEGWAHYCEQMMLDEGYSGKDERDTKMLRLGELLNALLRNARFIVGIQMHTGHMSMDDAVAYFVKEGYMPRQAAIVEVKRGISDPTYLYYTLGKLQILKLCADLQKKEGAAFDLRQFHDDFMKQGFPPIKIVRRALLGNDSQTL
jgi:hypothetical protein